MELDTVPQHHSQPPHKSASDSRVAALSTDVAQQQQNQHGQEHEGATNVGRTGGGNGRRRQQSQSQHEEEYAALKYGASHVILLFVPVSICMAVVTMTVASVGFYSKNDGLYLPYTPFHSDTDNAGIILAQSIANALIMLGFVIVATVVLVVLYYYRFYKTIHGWLIVSTVGLLTLFSFSFILEMFKNYNIPLDYASLVIFLWNWCMVGMICIHWKGPLVLQQFYLIVVSALMALLFIKYLPDWTVWTVLAILSIWDLVAVLSPKGPLRILVETTQERNEPILPALIYSSTVLYAYVLHGVVSSAFIVGAGVGTNGDDEDEQQQRQPQPNDDATDGQQDAASTSGLLTMGTEEEEEEAATAQTMATQAPVTTPLQRRGRSAGTSDGSANTLLTTVLTTSGGSTESRTQTLVASSSSASVDGDRRTGGAAAGVNRATRTAAQPAVAAASRASARSRSPRHPASERAVPVTAAAETGGVKLGLGDFIFYSVLVGKASSFGDWNVTIACYVSVLVGLAFTLMLLALYRKALPALPISIFTGISFFFATHWLITPFLAQVSVRQILL
ncbi:hypothetical protein niasHT_006875 [Heterodera trifolii]|uniref:Presenilin n=1 Tax=Heterodera trifolii TaxID=157864 RepID=A0ABD2LMU4_9BILA